MATLTLGSELAGYRIDALIGRGGMGVVYRATDLRLGRPVAIKLIVADRAAEPTLRQRFEREARLMAAIDHPNVLPVYAAGEEEGCLYLVMRYVAGTDLAALLRDRERLEPEHAVRITEQVAQALDAAHQAGLVHRDIKPANVLLAGEHTYLSDFGIGRAVEAATRLTDSNDWLGTVDFCSPEQLRGERTDARGDVYSLGCLLHTALTGTPPHHRDTAAATMLAHLTESPPSPSATPEVPGEFDSVVARSLAKRPAERYASAGELAEAARAALGGEARLHPPPTALTPSTRPSGGETISSRTRRLPPATRTKLDLRPLDEPAHPSRRPPSRRAIAAGALAALLAGLAIVVLASGSAGLPSGPLTRSEITSVVQRFARAYGQRDARTLGSLLAADVTRINPSATERGRPAVAAEYAAQFVDSSIRAYQLSGLLLRPGWVGRAAGFYAVVRGDRSTLTGRVVFGVVRVGGRPRIALIATEPPG